MSHESPSTASPGWPAGVLASLALFLVVYVVAYGALLESKQLQFNHFQNPLMARAANYPRYRIRSEAVTLIFWPAHQVDRLLRPTYWDP